MIRYEDSLETIRHYSLEGFCVGWKTPPNRRPCLACWKEVIISLLQLMTVKEMS